MTGGNVIDVIDNFLSKQEFNILYYNIFSKYFPWILARIDPPKYDYTMHNCQFVHMFCGEEGYSKYFHIIDNLCNQIQTCLDEDVLLVRAKCNITCNVGYDYPGFYHVDNICPGYTAIYYLNTCNGYTELESGEKIHSKENRLLIFPMDVKHRGVRSTDTPWRSVINFNFQTTL